MPTRITPRFLRNARYDPPSDQEIKDYLCVLSADELHALYRGPGGRRFHQMSKEALWRIAMEDLKDKPPANGRVACALVSFDETEVLPARRSKEKE